MGTTVKNQTKTNEVQKNTAPSWAEPGLAELGKRITQIIPTMPGPSYEGNFFAPVTARENAVPGMMEANANFTRSMTPVAQQVMGQAQQGASFGAGPGVGSFQQYDPSGMQSVIQSAMQPAFRRLQESVLPQLQSAGMESGAYGGDRAQQVLPAMAIRDTMGEVGDIASRMAYQDFSDMQSRQQQAYQMATQRGLGEADVMTQRYGMFPDLLDTVLRMQTGATDMDIGAAQFDNSLRQREIDEQLARQDYNVRRPFQGLDVAAALLGNLATPWGTRTSTGTSTNTQSTGGLGPWAQGALGAAMMAGGMPTAGGGSVFGNLFSRKPGGR